MTDQLAMETGDPILAPWVGITTVLGYTVWPGDWLLKWAWTLGRRNVLLTDPAAHGKRDAGRTLHSIWEDLARNGPEPVISQLLVTVRGHAESLTLWHRARRPRVLAVEFTARHPELRIDGRMDSIIECDYPGCRCAGRGVRTLDLKTGSVTDARSHLQVGGGYPVLWEGVLASGALPIDLRRPMCGGELVKVHEDGTVGESVPARDRRDGFMLALALYRDLEADGLPDRQL